MPQDIAYHFDVGPSIDLSSRVAVPKSMRADYLGRNTSQLRIVLDTMSEWRPRSSARRAYFFAERCAAFVGQVAVPALGRQSMPSRLRAAGEARWAHWFLAGTLSVCQLANPRPAIAVQELQLHLNRRWPAATESQSRVCLEVVIERSRAKSFAHPSKVRPGEAVHLCDIAVQSPHLQGQPISFL